MRGLMGLIVYWREGWWAAVDCSVPITDERLHRLLSICELIVVFCSICEPVIVNAGFLHLRSLLEDIVHLVLSFKVSREERKSGNTNSTVVRAKGSSAQRTYTHRKLVFNRHNYYYIFSTTFFYTSLKFTYLYLLDFLSIFLLLH